MAYLRYLDHIDPGQGGGAMVIPSYNWYGIPVKKEVFKCSQCSEIYETYDGWFNHRFHAHPILRPVLVLGTNELLTPRFVLTKALSACDVYVFHAKTCMINDQIVSILDLPDILASKDSGFYKVNLLGDGNNVESIYEISVDISSEDDLRTVETFFAELSSTGMLNIHSINNFIQSAKKEAKTAKKYIDGLANYLFALIGKDQRGQTGLNQQQALEKLNESHQTLKHIERPLARVVCAIMEFQFNSFSRYEGLRSVPRLEFAMKWYDSCCKGDTDYQAHQHVEDDMAIAKVPLDLATSELLTWIGKSAHDLVKDFKHIERRTVQADWLPSDRVKARVLLAVMKKVCGDEKSAKLYARSFRHDPVFNKLAEQLIDT